MIQKYIFFPAWFLLCDYISTAHKEGWIVWDAMADAIRGSTRLLEIEQKVAPQAIAV